MAKLYDAIFPRFVTLHLTERTKKICVLSIVNTLISFEFRLKQKNETYSDKWDDIPMNFIFFVSVTSALIVVEFYDVPNSSQTSVCGASAV